MPEVTLTGYLVNDPDLTYTPSGTPVCTFRLARNERYRDSSGEWKEGETLFITVTCWQQLAENVTNSLLKGSRAVVQGKIRTRSYEDRNFHDAEGKAAQRFVTELLADDVSASLRMATVKIAKNPRTGTGRNTDEDRSSEDPNGVGESS